MGTIYILFLVILWQAIFIAWSWSIWELIKYDFLLNWNFKFWLLQQKKSLSRNFVWVTLKNWLGVQQVSITSRGEDTLLVLVGHLSADGVAIKNTLWGRCFIALTSLTTHPFNLGSLNLIWIIKSNGTDGRRRMLLLAVINVNAYPFDYQLIIMAIWVILGTIPCPKMHQMISECR